MNQQSSRRAGLLLLGGLSVGDMAALLLTDGESPPYEVAALVTLLGLVSLVLVIRAWGDPARPVRLLVGLRALSAVAAFPAFLVEGVPAGAQVVAAAVVVLTVLGVVLTSGVARQVVTS
jgi:hypothetical protein